METGRFVRGCQPRRGVIVEQRCGSRCVTVSGGKQDLQLAVRAQRRRDSLDQPLVRLEQAAEQRTPRQGDGDQGCAGMQRSRQLVRGGGQEHGVLQAATAGGCSRTARRIGHLCGIGVDAYDENVRVLAGAAQNRLTRTGSQVDDHVRVEIDLLIQLADVHLEEASSNCLAHCRILIARWRNREKLRV